MRENRIREGLGNLSKDQAKILYWTLQGKSPEWITTNILKKERKTHDYHMGEIYSALGFDEKEHWSAKRERLIREVYPIFTELVKKEEDLEKWTVVKYQYAKVIKNQEQRPIPEEPKIFIKDETPAQGKPSETLKPPKSQPRSRGEESNRPKSWTLVLLGFLFGSIVSCVFIGLIVSAIYGNRPSNQAPSVILNEPLTITPSSTNTSSITSTPTIEPTATQTPSPTFTSTPTEEPTETPIPSPTLTPVPTPVVLFYDDFSKGMSQQILLLTGNINIVNGELSSAEEDTTLMIGDNSWTKYSVEYLAMPSSCWSSWGTNFIGLHAKDRNNMIAFLWQGCEFEWYIVKDGKWTAVVNSGDETPQDHKYKINIDVYDGNYIVNIEGEYVYTLYDTTYSSGGIVFILEKGTKIDDLKVVEWPLQK